MVEHCSIVASAMLSSPDPFKRRKGVAIFRRGAEYLTDSARNRLIEELRKLLKDDVEDVRLVAAEALNEIKARQSQISPAQRALTTQRANTVNCAWSLKYCQTSEEILRGFSRLALELEQTGDPLAQAFRDATTAGDALSHKDLCQMKENFIARCVDFLSATDLRL